MIEAVLEVLITTNMPGKDRGGPGISIQLRMTPYQWEELLEVSTRCSAPELARAALAYAVPQHEE